MRKTLLRVRFKGKMYVLAGTLKGGGPIATRDQYRHGRCSFAHLYPNGNISRFGETIGTVTDLKVLGPTTVTIADDAVDNMLFGPTFPRSAQLAMAVEFLKGLKGLK